MNTALAANTHAHCAAGFYAINNDGTVRCGLCGQPADMVTGHATVISALVIAQASRQPALRIVKGGR